MNPRNAISTKIRVYPRSHPRIPASTKSASMAFTYIELLITLTILAVLFVPVMQLFSHSLVASSTSQDLMTATSLARWEMERVKNLNVTKEQLSEIGDLWYPTMDKDPLEMNEMKWRIKRQIIEGTDPLEVRVHVYSAANVRETIKDEEGSAEVYIESEENRPIVTLVTLFEDMFWEEIRPIK